MARINVEHNGSRGKRSRMGSGRNNGAPVEFELARFCPALRKRASCVRPPRRLPRAGVFRTLVTSAAPRHIPDMVRIAISQAAFDAIARTLPFGSVGYENATNEKGERLIWRDPSVVDRLRSLRGPGESYSDVILRLAAEG
jgi:hypothetical protein